MTENDKLRPVCVQKADMALGDIAAGGRLQPQQLKQYIKIAIKKQVLMGMVRVTTIPTPEFNLPKMTTFGEVMKPATAGVALAVAERSAPGFSQVQLAAKLGRAEVDYPREVLEDQIERGAFKNSVIEYLATHSSRDLENLLINGNTVTGATAWLQLLNGLIAQTTTNTAAAGGVTLDKDQLRDLLELLPEEFDDQPGLKFFTNRKARNDYRQSISDRTGGLSDAVVDGSSNKQLGYDDFPLVKVPLFPNDLGLGSNETTVIFADPQNIVFAFYRKVTLDTEFAVRPQTYAIVLSLRMDTKYEHEPAAAQLTGILGQ